MPILQAHQPPELAAEDSHVHWEIEWPRTVVCGQTAIDLTPVCPIGSHFPTPRVRPTRVLRERNANVFLADGLSSNSSQPLVHVTGMNHSADVAKPQWLKQWLALGMAPSLDRPSLKRQDAAQRSRHSAWLGASPLPGLDWC